MAQIDDVNIYVYGVKSNWRSFAWLDLVHEHNPNADILMDIGFYFNVEQGGDICLVKPKQGHKFAGGGVSTSPCRGPALGKRTAPSVIRQGTKKIKFILLWYTG